MEYKVGDKVRIVSKRVGGKWNSNGLMDKWLGKVMTVRAVCDGCYKMEEDICEWGSGWTWYPWMIEGLARFTKSDLIPGQYVIKTKEGSLFLCLRKSNGDLFFHGVFYDGFLVDNFYEDLKNKYDEDFDIVKVYEFSQYSPRFKSCLNLVWERKPETSKQKQLENIVDPCDFFKEV